MSIFYGIDSNSVSTLFSSLGTEAGAGAGSNILSEYYNIRSGVYKKALTAYYSKMDKEEVSTKATGRRTSSSTSVSSDSAKTLKKIKSSADDLKNSAGELVTSGRKTVFNKTDVKKEDGTTAKEYDTDKIYEKVSEFVKDYNNMLDNAEDASSSNINSKVSNIKKYTDSNKNLLGKAGITVNKDGSMSLDKDEFKKADMATVKSIFNGTGSYGYYIQSKASMLSYYAEAEASKSSTYTSSGGYSYNYNTGDIFNSYM